MRCSMALCSRSLMSYLKRVLTVALMVTVLAPPSTAMAFDPCGSVSPSDEPVLLSVGASAAGTGKTVRRLSGAVRYDTMAAIATTGFSTADTVILASGENFPDALSASALAGAYGAPILLTARDALSAQAAQTINELKAKKVVVLGGTAAVSEAVVNSLKAKGLSVRRLYGNTRQNTAEAIAKEVTSVKTPDTVVVANSAAPWDSLSISPLAYAKSWPVLLTQGDGKLSSSSLTVLKSMKSVKKVVIVGGTNAVSSAVSSQLSDYTVERWWGATRYETSLDVASHAISLGLSASNVLVASGENYPDALAGGAFAGSKSGLVLLSSPSGTAGTFSFLKTHAKEISRCYLLGGTAALSGSVESSCRDALGLSETTDGSSIPEGKTVLLFSPHQDDEALSMGAFAVQALDHGCSVRAVLCTDGSASFVKRELGDGLTCGFHTGEHAYELSDSQFIGARDSEFQDSCKALGLTSFEVANVQGRAADSKLTVQKAKDIIRYYLAKYPGAVVCTTSPSVGSEQNSDHRVLGEAALELYREGIIDDLRLFVEPYYLNEFERGSPSINLDETSLESDAERASLTLAAASYRVWNPDASRFAVGYHSVGSYFDAMSSNGAASWWYSASSA